MKQHSLRKTPGNNVNYADKDTGMTEVQVTGKTNSVKQDPEKQFSGEEQADTVALDIFGALSY